ANAANGLLVSGMVHQFYRRNLHPRTHTRPSTNHPSWRWNHHYRQHHPRTDVRNDGRSLGIRFELRMHGHVDLPIRTASLVRTIFDGTVVADHAMLRWDCRVYDDITLLQFRHI